MSEPSTTNTIGLIGQRYTPPHVEGGHESVMLELTRQWQRLGWQVDIFTPSRRRYRSAESACTADNVTRLPVPDIRLLYNFLFARRLRKHLRTACPTAHTVTLCTHTLLAWRLWRLNRPPLIIRVASTSRGEARLIKRDSPAALLEYALRCTINHWAEGYILRHCDHIVVCSPHLVDELRTLFGIKPERITIIPNGIDCDLFHPRELACETEGNPPSQQPGTKNRLLILYVGRMSNCKNIELLLQAVWKLAESSISLELHLCGEGERRASLEQLANDLGIQESVHFHGMVDRRRLAECYRQADLFVLPSRYEGMPNVLLEAMASGLPAIATPFPGVENIIIPETNGLILKNHDPQELAEAIRRIATDHDLKTALGVNARERARTVFDWSSVATTYTKLFSSLCLNTTQRGNHHPKSSQPISGS